MNTTLVRPAEMADLAALTALAALASWPPHTASLSSASDETVLVAEAAGVDGEPAVLLGALRLRRAVGLALPRVWYHVGCTVHAASELNLFHRQRTLMLGHDHTGASELADIAVDHLHLPLAEQAATLHLLVQTALLLVARDRRLYAERTIAELPGPRDSAGQSPFWQGLGRHFYAGDRPSAGAAASAGHSANWRTHVAALLPRQPIYTSFLPDAAQAAIAQTHASALLLREVLEQAGLRYSHHVNVEDAGPVLEALTDDLFTVRRARCWTLTPASEVGGTAFVVLAAGPDGAWRAGRVRAQVQGAGAGTGASAGAGLGLSTDDLDALEIQAGASVWAAPLGGDDH